MANNIVFWFNPPGDKIKTGSRVTMVINSDNEIPFAQFYVQPFFIPASVMRWAMTECCPLHRYVCVCNGAADDWVVSEAKRFLIRYFREDVKMLGDRFDELQRNTGDMYEP